MTEQKTDTGLKINLLQEYHFIALDIFRKTIYNKGIQVYEMCRSVERVMGMFSRELKELDDNTVEFMIDELKEMVDKEKARADQAENQVQVEKVRAKEAENRANKAEALAKELQKKYEELLKQQK